MNMTKDEKLIEARTRQANADAALKELRYKEKSGLLVKKDEILAEVRKEWKETVANVKAKILAVRELAPQLSGLETVEIDRILARWSKDTCNEFADRYR